MDYLQVNSELTCRLNLANGHSELTCSLNLASGRSMPERSCIPKLFVI